MDKTRKHCKECASMVMAERPSPSHILHLILTLLTGGLWLIVWLGVSVRWGGWRCSRCGSKL